MSEADVMEPTEQQPDEDRVSGLAAIVGPTINAIVAPGKAYATLATRPGLSGWILVWVLVGTIAVAFLNLDVQRQFVRVAIIESQAQGNQSLDAEQLANIIQRMDRFAPVTAVAQNVFLVLVVFVVAAIIWGGSTVLGGKARFSRALSVAAVGSVIHPLLATSYVGFNWFMSPPEIRRLADIADAVPSIGLDLLVGSNQMSFAMRTFLMHVDLFNIWWIVLVVMGSERLLGLKRGAAVGLALVIWLLSAALSAGMASLSG